MSRRLSEIVISRIAATIGKTEDDNDLDSLRSYYSTLRAVETAVSNLTPGSVRQAQYCFFGIVSRAYQLAVCAGVCLDMRNLNGFYCALRSLVETIGFVVHCSQNPDRLASAYNEDRVRVGTLTNTAFAKYARLKSIYTHASGIVHPGRDSFAINFHTEPNARGAVVTGLILDFSEAIAIECFKFLCDVCSILESELRAFSETQQEALCKGKVVARVTDEGDLKTHATFKCQHWTPMPAID